MIDRSHALPLTRQADVLGLSRGSLYYKAAPVPMRILSSCVRWTSCTRTCRFAALGCCAAFCGGNSHQVGAGTLAD